MYKYNTSYLLPIGAGVNVNKLKQFEINHLSSQSREQKKSLWGFPKGNLYSARSSSTMSTQDLWCLLKLGDHP